MKKEIKRDPSESVRNTVKAISSMEKIEPLKVAYAEALLEVERKGVTTTQLGAGTDYIHFQDAILDIVAYLFRDLIVYAKRSSGNEIFHE